MFFAHLPRPRNKRPPMDRRAVKAQVEISNDRPNESLSVLRNENADSIVNGIVIFEAILFIVPPPPFYIRSVEVSLLEITTFAVGEPRTETVHTTLQKSLLLCNALCLSSLRIFSPLSFVIPSHPPSIVTYNSIFILCPDVLLPNVTQIILLRT